MLFKRLYLLRKTKNINSQTHIATKQVKPIRLQDYGVGIFSGILTKSALKKALKKDYISINGYLATSATFILGGELLIFTIPKYATHKKPFRLNLEVLFEDDHLAIIKKPAGVLVSGNSFKTVVNALVQNLKKSTLPDATKPQPIHRLDFATTGVLLIGKTTKSIIALNTLFKDRTIKKKYYAITIGNMPNNGVIDFNVDNKKAVSNYAVIESVTSKRFGVLNLVNLSPQTGRKHQLRIHLASIGHPILGDKDYGVSELILKGKGMYLHAYSLTFTHPFTHEKLTIKDILPNRFKKIFN